MGKWLLDANLSMGVDCVVDSSDDMLHGFSYEHIINTFISAYPEEKRTRENLRRHIQKELEMRKTDMWQNFTLFADEMLKAINGNDEQMYFRGKEIYTVNTFNINKAEIGDFVDEQVVNLLMDSLPPRIFLPYLKQMGEPVDHRKDVKTGEIKPTYQTFFYVANLIDKNGTRVWKYCGDCFAGEWVPRGEELPIVK